MYLEFIEPGGAPIEARGFRRGDIDQTIEASYEVRMRANTMNVHASASMDFSNTGHDSLSWNFIGDSHSDYVGDPNGHNFRLHMGAGTPSGAIVLEESVVGDFSDWHTYHVTVQRVGGVGFTVAKLYVDDNLTNLIDPNSHFGNAYQNPGSNHIVVHTQDPFAEDTDIDYIRWTTTGEFAPIVTCDFDGNTTCGLADINLLMGQGDLTVGVSVGSGNQFDLNSDNIINEADITEWLDRVGTRASYGLPFLRGDTELDHTFPTVRTVDITDFQNFLVGFTGAGTSWQVGNFDGNDEVDITDFSIHFLPNFTATAGGSYGPSQSIPEPSTVLLLGLGGALLAYVTATPAPPEHSRVT